MPISEVTRKAITDELSLLEVSWSGRFDEVTFLNRLYDLDQLPSHDIRLRNAASDIKQHRVSFLDWDDNWVFEDDRFELYFNDQAFLSFLAETVHPAVRPDPDAVRDLVAVYNRHLRHDGWELVPVADISGRPVYGARRVMVIPEATQELEEAVAAGDMVYLAKQVQRLRRGIEDDPELAIGTAKELVETVCKTVLTDLNVEIDPEWSIGRLLKETLDRVLGEDKADASTRKIAGGLNTTIAGLAELRNDQGTGHGHPAQAVLPDRQAARLAAGAASAVAIFVFEAYNARNRDQR